MKSARKQGFTLVELLVVIGILGILSAALYPAITSAVQSAQMTAVGARGKDIYVAIVAANTEREPLGLGNIWPRNGSSEGGGSSGASGEQDIADKTYNSAYQYFKDLYDEDNRQDATKWAPYAIGFDYSKLAGAGVKTPPGGKLTSMENCMWSIAANIRDEIEDVIPILVTRNVNCAQLASTFNGSSSGRVGLGSANGGYKSDAPFGAKAFVMVQKGGGIHKATGRYATLNVIYKQQQFDLKVGAGGNPFVYLGESAITPSGS